jgi:1-acyl-sn-glycerol-3-phosphate acyltransferase
VFDIPIMMGHLPGCPAFVAKKELFAIPILGRWMRRVGCIPIDRERAREAHKSIESGAEQVRAGRRMVLFPEGTRSRDPAGRVGRFKRGALQMAVKAGAVVVPVTVEGSRFLLSTARAENFRGEVRVVIGDPVDVTALDDAAQKALPDQLGELISRTREANFMGEIPPHLVAP